ncbi:uncharacterized protein EI90DRAFT_3132885 [Cantharellus anzutake]|uniref:uncharacterized protein n=1 Tax=Cantharellus anzutake TaxID=1750568 RepID=UPI00190563AB|nr:uncharacterized protein EI90DRAFT_3132885 [Cantharellus anzutake]KAF8318905.1 hypothetical protein EI90DRAFT_3132885 [Cantharellus anzutake]
MFPSPDPTQGTVPTFLPTQQVEDCYNGSQPSGTPMEDGPDVEDHFILFQLPTHVDSFFQNVLGEYASHQSAQNLQRFFTTLLGDDATSWSIMKGDRSIGGTEEESSSMGGQIAHSSPTNSHTPSLESPHPLISIQPVVETDGNGAQPSNSPPSYKSLPCTLKRHLSGEGDDGTTAKRQRGTQLAGPSGTHQQVVLVECTPESHEESVVGSQEFQGPLGSGHGLTRDTQGSVTARAVPDVLGTTNYFEGTGSYEGPSDSESHVSRSSGGETILTDAPSFEFWRYVNRLPAHEKANKVARREVWEGWEPISASREREGNVLEEM